jgi:serine/threonine protein phosphatase 1
VRWIIGDIHGMLRPLEVLVRAVQKKDPEAKLYFVGDYVNRGPDSRRTIDFLLTLKNAKFIRGNHDDIFDLILHRQCFAIHPDVRGPGTAFKTFLEYGLDKTLHSYGISEPAIKKALVHPGKEELEELLRPVPESHRKFIRALPAMIEDPDMFVLHAKWNTNEPTENPDINTRLVLEPSYRHTIIWSRFDEQEIQGKKPWERTGYFGHTPVANYLNTTPGEGYVPVKGPKIVLLDTGIALSQSGRLTAFCHETRRYMQSDRAGAVTEAH